MKSKHTNRLLITSGDGPKECRLAVLLALRQMEKDARAVQLSWEVVLNEEDAVEGVSSALVTLSGEKADQFAGRWIGTLQWVSQSPYRPTHKRRNWFIGIFGLPARESQSTIVQIQDVRFETYRAGGPGGQHQNKTDSAVRATHIPTGQSVVSKDERSQHSNKRIALERLADRLFLLNEQVARKEKFVTNRLHKQLERGNPKRRFVGKKFKEDS